MNRTRLGSVLALAIAVGCSGPSTDEDAGGGSDAGRMDAGGGGSDAGMMDAGGGSDAGMMDAGGGSDAGMMDAFVPDAGSIDAGVDAGRAMCPPLDPPTNGSVLVPDPTEGGIATYACDTGFGLNGSATRTCGSDGAWSGAAPTCEPLCPCFGDAELDMIEAVTGTRTCVVDAMGGGTTSTVLVMSSDNGRDVAEALQNASLPGTQLACSYGCLDDPCTDRPPYVRTDDISVEQHASCRALIAARCAP